MSTLQYRVSSPREAHDTVLGLYQGVMKPHTRGGAAGVITWQTESSYLRTKLRAAFHGPVLKAISEQVWFTDEATGCIGHSTESARTHAAHSRHQTHSGSETSQAA